jgi:uncharacterized protein
VDGDARAAILNYIARALIIIVEQLGVSSANVNFCMQDEAKALERNGWFLRTGVQYHWVNCDPSGARFTNFDGFLATMKSSKRIKLKRERRRVLESGVQISVLSGLEISDDLILQMHKVYASTIDKQGPWGRLYLSQKFFALLAEVRDFRKFLTFCIARNNDGHLVAGTFNLCNDSTLYGRYWGILPQFERTGKYRDLHFELSYYVAQDYIITRGLEKMEPGAGGGDFKERRGYAPTRTFSLHYVARKTGRLRGAIEQYCIAECRAMEIELFGSIGK